MLLTPLRPWSEHVVLKSFHETVEKSPEQTNFERYKDLRKFRESFLASNGFEHFKSLIHKEDKLRLTLTYLLSSNVFILIILFVVNQNTGIYKEIIQFETWIAIFTFLMTLFGEYSRSKAIVSLKLVLCQKSTDISSNCNGHRWTKAGTACNSRSFSAKEAAWRPSSVR